MEARAETSGMPRSWMERIGIYPPLAWGYAGLLLFMIGDGVEAGYLSLYLIDPEFSQKAAEATTEMTEVPYHVAIIFTIYGLTVSVASWLSGALSDLFGPRRVMTAGLCIWVAFEVAFLLLGVAPGNYELMRLFYGLRGFGYPLFAYGFLVWVTAVTPRVR